MLTYDPKAEHMIDFRNICKSFGSKTILRNISFTVNKKEVLAVIGPSGAGKSTILKIISNLLEADSGEVIVGSLKKSMAFQYSALLNFLTVKENVALPLRKKTTLSNNEIDKIVSETLESVGLNNSENLFPQELSGGMQKRVGFARAIVTNPDIILYDEPTSGLDPMTSSMIIRDICKVKERVSAAGIIVTHDLETIDQAADKVILLYDGDIVFYDTPEALQTSLNPYAQQFYNGRCEGPIKICPNIH
ncbi:MAG: ABC transporter ATP-binding protein [Vampirovibrionia bacterium]